MCEGGHEKAAHIQVAKDTDTDIGHIDGCIDREVALLVSVLGLTTHSSLHSVLEDSS